MCKKTMNKCNKEVSKNIQMKHPLSKASICSNITYAWLRKTFLNGYQRDLTVSDLYPPFEDHSSSLLDNRLHKLWEEEKVQCKKRPGGRPSLIRVLIKAFGGEIMIVGMIQLVFDTSIRLVQPVLVFKLLSFFGDRKEISLNEASCWAAGITLSLVAQAHITNYVWNTTSFIGMKMRIACSSLIYRKVLKTSMISLEKNTTVGQVMNLITNDVSAIEFAMSIIHYTWTAPIQTVFVAWLVYEYVSLSAISGTCIFFLLLPLQALLSAFVPRTSHKASAKTDERLRLINEIVNCIQVIKMFAWEKSFVPLVQVARKKEMNDINKLNILTMSSYVFRTYTAKIALFVSLIFYITFDYCITAEKVFLMTAFYNDLQTTMSNFFASSLQQFSSALASIKRLEDFLLYDEIIYSNPESSDSKSSNSTNSPEKAPAKTVSLEKISAKWSSEPKEETLKDIDLSVKSGSLVAIIGQVGSGKSSLLHLILHELPMLKGSVTLEGKIAYISQDPWIFSSSVRKNILFNLPMEKDRYKQVVKVCQLERDFSLFPHSDQTMIGEKGINLSGGQRARIALARAVYADADVYLLDDPLSAVDARVGRLIFEECICCFLKNKARIFVTHQLQYLKDVDFIYVLNDGKVEMKGTYRELQHFTGSVDIPDDPEITGDSNNSDYEFSSHTVLEAGHIISETVEEELPEIRTSGKITMNVYLEYLKSVGNLPLILFFFFFAVLKQTVFSGADYSISNWAKTQESYAVNINATKVVNSFEKPRVATDWWYIYLYGGLTALSIVTTYGEVLIYCKMCQLASQGLHSSMFCRIIHGTMAFFYRNPTGRILNRFSRDMGTIDKEMPITLNDVIRICLLLLAVISLTEIVNYWFVVPAVCIGIVVYCIFNVYTRTSTSLNRLDGITRSPILQHVNDTLRGLPTIRAFQAETFLKKEFHRLQDTHTSAYSLSSYSKRAFRYYVDLLFTLYMLIISYSFILTGKANSIGDVGMIITQTLLLVGTLKWGVFQATEMGNMMTSVERVLEFTKIEKEPELETSLDKQPPKEWPQEGLVEFRRVFLKYYEHDEPILKNLSFIVQPREKIGIVGRTGAGKSSLVAALFRLTHLEGEIIIDGVLTSDLGLYDLRSKISIIPQQPLLFSGSLRRNLDPFEEYSDDLLWQALEDVELKNAVADLADGLVTKVLDGGLNFSVGQRQLLCLARAIVKQNRILVLDEATANVDAETDSLIQKAIRKRFENCTVFIIAHRLNTIMDCDKCMVIDAGRIVEFDQPSSLLDKKEGFLYDMVQQTGTETAALLERMSKRQKL